uniref:Uncharacterized protein n=1 Tax=Schistosoma mansoni TaxID=6183 RepID=A0A5K4FAN7_SCHMA
MKSFEIFHKWKRKYADINVMNDPGKIKTSPKTKNKSLFVRSNVYGRPKNMKKKPVRKTTQPTQNSLYVFFSFL